MRKFLQVVGLIGCAALVAVIANESFSDTMHCPSCGSRDIKQRPSLVQPGDELKFAFWQCNKCDFLWDERL